MGKFICLKLTLTQMTGILLVCLSILTPKAWARYGGGTGEPNDPYRIVTAEDLNDIGRYEEDWDKHFILTADIDLQGVSLSPVGNYNQRFTGDFDGNNYIIRNADVNMPSSNFVGLFGYVGSGGRIRNLGLEDVAITGENGVGGLAGANEGTLTGCYTSGSVNGTEESDDVGGLAGLNYSGSITGCYSTCSLDRIEESDNLGGLVGWNSGDVTDCYATGSINGSDDCDRVGGLVGLNVGSLAGCYSTGSVRSSSRVGGLVGGNSGSITACYATGSVEGDFGVGGLVGVNLANIAHCYSTGKVDGVEEMAGGLFGENSGAVIASFWDVETSDCNFSPGGEGKTTAQMKDINTFLDAGWDFVAVWWMPPGNYPHLLWQRLYSGGSGTQDDPYLISKVADWQKLIDTAGDWDKHFILTANIDLKGVALSPVGNFSQRFTGVFDGKGHILRNADVNMPSSDYVGLFGYVSWHVQISNLGVKDVVITGRNYVGGLVGLNEGDLTGCYATGSVEGIASVGGLVGDNSADLTGCYAACSVSGDGFIGGLVAYSDEDCDLTACYATSTVKGTGYCIGGLVGLNHSNLDACYATGPVDGNGVVGGLVGSNGEDGCIIDCYSTGPVSGMNWVGGLAAYNGEHSSITTCYATGLVDGNEVVGGLVAYKDEEGSTTACFWDVNTTGQNTSVGGEGKTTAEMKTIDTFTDAGWDFVEVWGVGENQTYPFLRTTPAGDLNYDKEVNLLDLAILASHWLEERK